MFLVVEYNSRRGFNNYAVKEQLRMQGTLQELEPIKSKILTQGTCALEPYTKFRVDSIQSVKYE